MKKTIASVALSLALMSSTAMAQERAGAAALGALSGAVVLGPVGAVAGAFIGYSAGPSIAHSWGIRRSASSSRVRRAAQDGSARQERATALPTAPPPLISAESLP